MLSLSQFVQDPEPVRLVLNSKQENAITNQTIVRILVVDDFAPWRHFVSTISQIETGWHVIGEASDGLEAVQKSRKNWRRTLKLCWTSAFQSSMVSKLLDKSARLLRSPEFFS